VLSRALSGLLSALLGLVLAPLGLLVPLPRRRLLGLARRRPTERLLAARWRLLTLLSG